MRSSPKHIRKRLAQLASQPSVSFYERATLIADLHEMASVSDVPELAGISRRRLYYLLEVGRLVRDRELSKAQAEAVGWTKMKTIARHLAQSGDVSNQRMADCLTLAQQCTARELSAALDGQHVEPTRSAVFHLTSGERSELDEALIAFGAEKAPGGLVKKEEALLSLVRTAMESGPAPSIDPAKT